MDKNENKEDNDVEEKEKEDEEKRTVSKNQKPQPDERKKVILISHQSSKAKESVTRLTTLPHQASLQDEWARVKVLALAHSLAASVLKKKKKTESKPEHKKQGNLLQPLSSAL